MIDDLRCSKNRFYDYNHRIHILQKEMIDKNDGIAIPRWLEVLSELFSTITPVAMPLIAISKGIYRMTAGQQSTALSSYKEEYLESQKAIQVIEEAQLELQKKEFSLQEKQVTLQEVQTVIEALSLDQQSVQTLISLEDLKTQKLQIQYHEKSIEIEAQKLALLQICVLIAGFSLILWLSSQITLFFWPYFILFISKTVEFLRNTYSLTSIQITGIFIYLLTVFLGIGFSKLYDSIYDENLDSFKSDQGRLIDLSHLSCFLLVWLCHALANFYMKSVDAPIWLYCLLAVMVSSGITGLINDLSSMDRWADKWAYYIRGVLILLCMSLACFWIGSLTYLGYYKHFVYMHFMYVSNHSSIYLIESVVLSVLIIVSLLGFGIGIVSCGGFVIWGNLRNFCAPLTHNFQATWLLAILVSATCFFSPDILARLFNLVNLG